MLYPNEKKQKNNALKNTARIGILHLFKPKYIALYQSTDRDKGRLFSWKHQACAIIRHRMGGQLDQ